MYSTQSNFTISKSEYLYEQEQARDKQEIAESFSFP